MQTHSRPFFMFILILGSLTAVGPLSIDMYLPAFPAMAESLGVAQGRIELSLAAFFAGLSIGQLIYGPVSDRFGRKKPLYFGLALYTLASVACALAASSDQLILFRLFQALGGCAGIVVSRAMVRDLFDHRESAQVFSMLMLVMGVAPILAPLAGGYILIFFGWRAIFWTLAACSILMAVIIALRLPETRQPDETVKFSRIFQTYLDILRHRTFLGYTLVGAFAQAGLFSYITGSSFVFIEYFHIPAEHFGWFFGVNALGLIGMSQINAWLLRKDKQTPDQLMQKALIGLGVFGSCMAFTVFMQWGLWGMMLPLFGFMSMMGIIFPNATAGALEHQKQRAGAASALAGTIQFSLSAMVAGSLSMMHATTPLPMAIILALCGITALTLFMRMKNYRPADMADTPCASGT